MLKGSRSESQSYPKDVVRDLLCHSCHVHLLADKSGNATFASTPSFASPTHRLLAFAHYDRLEICLYVRRTTSTPPLSVLTATKSYNKYAQITARAVRNAFKEDQRVLAEKRGLTSVKYQKWENGTGGPQVRDSVLPIRIPTDLYISGHPGRGQVFVNHISRLDSSFRMSTSRCNSTAFSLSLTKCPKFAGVTVSINSCNEESNSQRRTAPLPTSQNLPEKTSAPNSTLRAGRIIPGNVLPGPVI